MQGGASLTLLLGCLVAAEPPDYPVVLAPLDTRVPVADLPTGQGVAPAGTVAGDCLGVGWVELVDARGEILGREQVLGGSWSFSSVSRPITTLRYGCDRDGDGVVPAAEVGEIDATKLPEKGAILVFLPPA